MLYETRRSLPDPSRQSRRTSKLSTTWMTPMRRPSPA